MDSGFRRYPPETVDRNRFIRQAEKLGFALKEIDELLSLRSSPARRGLVPGDAGKPVAVVGHHGTERLVMRLRRVMLLSSRGPTD